MNYWGHYYSSYISKSNVVVRSSRLVTESKASKCDCLFTKKVNGFDMICETRLQHLGARCKATSPFFSDGSHLTNKSHESSIAMARLLLIQTSQVSSEMAASCQSYPLANLDYSTEKPKCRLTPGSAVRLIRS